MTPRLLSLGDPTLPRQLDRALRDGAVIVFPTDTVYGLGGDPWSVAVERVRTIKQRPPDQPFSLHLPSVASIAAYARVDAKRWRWLERWLPGPFTVLLEAGPGAPPCSVADDRVGLRVPDHPLFLEILVEIDRPVFGTSVNRRGAPPINDATKILKAFPEIDLVIEGPISTGSSSALIDLTSTRPVALRGELPDASR
jgi:L-threonylcarbamoyladenylate synthase